jgi:hypothetical protein
MTKENFDGGSNEHRIVGERSDSDIAVVTQQAAGLL